MTSDPDGPDRERVSGRLELEPAVIYDQLRDEFASASATFSQVAPKPNGTSCDSGQ